MVRNAPPDRSTTSCLPRRPTASIRRPTTPSQNASSSPARSVRCHSTPRTDDRRPPTHPARLEVAGDRLDLGKFGHDPGITAEPPRACGGAQSPAVVSWRSRRYTATTNARTVPATAAPMATGGASVEPSGMTPDGSSAAAIPRDHLADREDPRALEQPGEHAFPDHDVDQADDQRAARQHAQREEHGRVQRPRRSPTRDGERERHLRARHRTRPGGPAR